LYIIGPVKGWRIILVACALLWSGADAFALHYVPADVTPENRCTRVFDSAVSRARYYSPQTGRFWTMDTFEGNNQDPLSLHKYLYCAADPVDGTDRTGLWREIASDFDFGRDAEPPVIADFIARRPYIIGQKLSIHGILGYSSTTGYKGLGRLIPDLVDGRTYEIYDIKSWDKTPAGMIKVAGYRVAFYLADPDPTTKAKWHAGVTYNYGGPNPFMLSRKSNGKNVCVVYYDTQAGVIPYKLFEYDDENDKRLIPVPVPVRVRKPAFEDRVYVQPVGTLIYANYYARTAARNLALATEAGLLTCMAIATINAMQGAE
jgi:RHS repeat-associated protein